MDDLMDMLATDDSPASISDKIKEILFAKSAEKIDATKPDAATSLFGQEVESENEVETEITNEIDPEEESNG
tara:strand:- start:2488 stop:2703 length:216 start_codon:yes stop_codon:yes gene_type:complete